MTTTMIKSDIRELEGIRSLAAFYSTANFKNILTENNFKNWKDRYKKYSKNIFGKKHSSLYSFLEELYSFMIDEYRNEYIIKNEILNKLLLGRHSPKTTTLLDELKIGQSKADVVLINGSARVYEIKSNLDNLERLDNQIKDYRTVFDEIVIVADGIQIEKLIEMYSQDSLGLIEFTEERTLRTRKELRKDQSRLDYEVLFKLLRKSEYLEIIENNFGQVPEVPNTKIFKESLQMVKSIDLIAFQKLVFEQLKKRKVNRPDYLMNSKTPYELKYICHSLNLNERQYNKLYELLNRSF